MVRYVVSVIIALYTWTETCRIKTLHFYKCKYLNWKKSEAHYIRARTVSGNGTTSRCFARRVKLAVVVSATRITGLCNVDTTVAAGLAYWLGCRSLGSSHSRLIYYRARSLAILFYYRVWARLFVTSCAVLRSLILTAHDNKPLCIGLFSLCHRGDRPNQ